ncbi:MAG TPA: hypothetical protein VGY58_05530 [Gemmataceae bacterium]|nr:hypothetical protein [Gemmataceae bacterium]
MMQFGSKAALVFATGLLAMAPVLRAEPLPLPPNEQKKVNDALLKAVVYVANRQGIDGCWTPADKPHRVGYAALPAMALLECGVSPNHSTVQKAAAFLGEASAKEGNTYDLALTIMFLDRLIEALGDGSASVLQKEQSIEVIRVLAFRLIAGQTVTGGWTYSCPAIDRLQHEQLRKALEAKRPERTKLAAWLKKLAIFQEPAKLMVKETPAGSRKKSKKPAQEPEKPKEDDADNSNSHFAILALWVAQRYDVRVERTFRLVGKRFRTSQNEDGGWGYKYKLGGAPATTPAMTCTGLVGLAIERGFTTQEDKTGLSLTAQASLNLASAVANPSLPLRYLAARAINRAATRDAVALKALQTLSNHVGQPTGKTEGIPLGDLYFLWALERVAMIYDLQTVGDKDWYRWGAEMLLANIKPDGYWDVKTFGGAADEVINSCFAMLFLRQANLANDLTARLRADPGLLDKLAKKDPPAETKASLPAPPPPAEKSGAPANSSSAPKTEVKSAPAETSRPAAASTPPPAPTPAPTVTEPAAPAPKESNKVLLWVAAGVAVVLIGVAAVLLVVGLKQGKEEPDEPRSRPASGKKRPSEPTRRNGAGRRTKAKRQEET